MRIYIYFWIYINKNGKFKKQLFHDCNKKLNGKRTSFGSNRWIIISVIRVCCRRRASSSIMVSKFLHDLVILPATMRAVPFTFWLATQLDTLEMKPLNLAQVVVAANHLAIRNLTTYTIYRLRWVCWKVHVHVVCICLVAVVVIGFCLLVDKRLDACLFHLGRWFWIEIVYIISVFVFTVFFIVTLVVLRIVQAL